MAHICLALLLEPQVVTLSNPGVAHSMYPFTRYAALYWPYHYEESARTANIQAQIFQLFKDLDGSHQTFDGIRRDTYLDFYKNPLCRASFLGLTSTISQLFKEGGSTTSEYLDMVNAEGGSYGTALIAAASRGHREIVQLLLNNGARVDETGENKIHGTALYEAAGGGYRDIVQLLLNHGAQINSVGEKTGMALNAPVARGRREMVRFLLDNGAQINSTGGEYGTALHLAAACGHWEMVQFLLDNGAEINGIGGKYGLALYTAAARGHRDIVQLLLDNGAKVNNDHSGGLHGSALTEAAGSGYREIVQFFLDIGADVNVTDAVNGTPLQAAAAHGHRDIMQLLLDNGADINKTGGVFWTALQAAVANNLRKFFTGFFQKGSQNLAATDSILETVRFLLERGAEVNANGGHYGTALHAAAACGYQKIVQLLLDNGAEVNIKEGSETKTRKKHMEQLYTLQRYGAIGKSFSLFWIMGPKSTARARECTDQRCKWWWSAAFKRLSSFS